MLLSEKQASGLNESVPGFNYWIISLGSKPETCMQTLGQSTGKISTFDYPYIYSLA
jgi:hypothetical protein